MAHQDAGGVYLNSVLTLYGDGTHYWNTDVLEGLNERIDLRKVKDVFPPSGQTIPGEILVLTGLKRSTALNRPELATLHAGPDMNPRSNRLVLLFYFDSLNE